MQKTKKSGLPGSMKMRHDGHFVELITSRTSGPQIRMIAIQNIFPNPQQARSELGNIEELMASIKEKGVLEPILVRQKEGRYEIIAGERRCIAAKRIGLKEIACIEMNVEDNEAMELALIENLQRKDLDAFEEADGLKALSDIYGYNHSQIAEKIGKSRSSITEIIALGRIPKDIRDLCKQYSIKSQTTLIEIAKQKTSEHMMKLIEEIQKRDLKREDTRELSKKIKGTVKRPVKYIYNLKSSGNFCRIKMVFNKDKVDKNEIIRVLEEILSNLKKSS